MIDVTIPSLGIAMEEAVLSEWLKQAGDPVAAGEAVAEIETDKATVALESPVAGTLGPHLVEAGTVVPVGATVVRVSEDGEEPGTGAAGADAAADAVDAGLRAAPPREVAPVERAGARHGLSPRARRLARHRGEEQWAAPERFRELIAAKVSEAWREIPHFAVTRETDGENLLAHLAGLRESANEPRPTVTDLLLRALALAISDTHGDGEVDLGLATATEHGVAIPVVRNVLSLDPEALAAARTAAVERARSARLSQEDLQASPLTTLSNLGPWGVDQFTGIIASGQSSLLTVGRVAARVVAGESRELRIRRTFYATLNVDHRLLDGVGAARLLSQFVSRVEARGLF